MNPLAKLDPVKRHRIEQYTLMVAGDLIFAIAVNMIITPMNLYNGGFTGISQLLRLFFLDVVHVQVPTGFNLLGVIYFIINVPLFYMAYKSIGRTFCINTLIAILISSVCMSFIPVPEEPIIHDMLTACLIGGVVAGSGAGMVMRGGMSGGGQDIIGVCLSVTHPNWSVGGISIAINVLVFAVCFFLFDIEVVVYSLIYTTVLAMFLDRMFIQNINDQAMIFTKSPEVADAILTKLQRGVTNWDGTGAYTGEKSYILVTMISKYEVNRLLEIVHGIDPNAFVIVNEKAHVYGNFQKRLTD